MGIGFKNYFLRRNKAMYSKQLAKSIVVRPRMTAIIIILWLIPPTIVMFTFPLLDGVDVVTNLLNTPIFGFKSVVFRLHHLILNPLLICTWVQVFQLFRHPLKRSKKKIDF
jgi:hypothetical protein